MNSIMLDLETTGVDPVHNHIIQIAAVRFDLESKTLHDDMFDQCLVPDVPGRYWDEGTQNWWSEHGEVLDGLYSRMRPPGEVLNEFQQWLCKIPVGQPLKLWAKPSSFEYPFITSYFKQFEVMNPIHYRYVVDLNSYIFGRGHNDIDEFWRGVAPVGDKHNALHDVLYQVRGAFQA